MSTQKKKQVIKILKGRMEQVRMEAGLTQPQLARLLGKSRTWISFRERGKRRLYLHDLEQIAKILRKPVVWFIKRDTEKESLVWKAKQYDKMIQEVEKFFSTTMGKHYTEMSDEEIDAELERLGISDARFKPLLKAIPVLSEEEKRKILRSFCDTG